MRRLPPKAPGPQQDETLTLPIVEVRARLEALHREDDEVEIRQRAPRPGEVGRDTGGGGTEDGRQRREGDRLTGEPPGGFSV